MLRYCWKSGSTLVSAGRVAPPNRQARLAQRWLNLLPWFGQATAVGYPAIVSRKMEGLAQGTGIHKSAIACS